MLYGQQSYEEYCGEGVRDFDAEQEWRDRCGDAEVDYMKEGDL